MGKLDSNVNYINKNCLKAINILCHKKKEQKGSRKMENIQQAQSHFQCKKKNLH